MKLLVINWQDLRNPHAGGAEIHLFELCRRLVERGHQIRMVCSGFPGAPIREVVDGVEVHRSGGRHSFALTSARAIRRMLASEQPDVVIDDVNKLPLAVPLLTRRPVYAIVPHLFGTTAFQEAPWPMAATVWGCERFIPSIHRRAWFHAISESTKDDLVQRGIDGDRIAVVHPGVDAVHYAPDPAVPKEVPPRLVYLGRLKRYKGVEFLLQALVLARRTHPDLSLDVAGTGDDRTRLESMAGELGLSGAVRFLGFVDDDTKLRLLRGAVANVLPSPKEGWGITVMEAAACGTPSIASDSPGLRDSVLRDVSGLLVPHGQPEPLAQAINRLVSDPPFAARLGGAARTHALAHSWDAATDQMEMHLLDLAAGRVPPPSFRG